MQMVAEPEVESADSEGMVRPALSGEASLAPTNLPLRPQIEVFTEIFNGPLELLLALVEREEIDLFELQLTAMTQTYLAQLVELPSTPPEEMAEFLWLAARLILLKSIRLLPGEQPEPEENELLGWEESVRRQLQEYQLCQKLARELMARREREVESYPAPVREVEARGKEEPLQVDSLLIAFQGLL
ncbi:MAG: segregation and condensation protein A, partial [Candidatus Dormibacteraceae bacterium]